MIGATPTNRARMSWCDVDTRRTSPSTIDTDRGRKLDFASGLAPERTAKFHKSLPTVRHIALVYQDQMRVEHYRRTDIGFELDVLKSPGDRLHFEAVEFGITIDRVYFGVEV